MNNKSGLVVIAAGIAAFLVIKGGRDSGSLFGSGGGDSGQPTGTILAGPGTSSPASSPAPSSLWSPSPTNNSPQSFGYVTSTGTYITPFPISDKILAAMQNQNQNKNQNQLGYSNPSAYNPVPSNVKDANILNNIFGNNAANIPKLNLSQYSPKPQFNTAAEAGIIPKKQTYAQIAATPYVNPFSTGALSKIGQPVSNTGLDKYGYTKGSQWSPAYAEAGGYHGDSRNYATAVQLKRVPGLFVSSTGVHTAPRY